jgi:hypothetical protein
MNACQIPKPMLELHHFVGEVMGRTKDLFNEIVDMFNNGYDAEDIAVVLNVPIDEVENVLDSLNNPSANNVPY